MQTSFSLAKKLNLSAILCLILATIISCKKASTTNDSSVGEEDSSTSGAIVMSIGGALAGSDSNGSSAFLKQNIERPELKIWNLLLQKAHASLTLACPTLKTENGAGCTNNGTVADLTYDHCSFATKTASWTGTLQFSIGGSSTSVSCGTFPDISSLPSNARIQRQFVTSGTPGTATRTNAAGTLVTIDHLTIDLGNQVGDSIPYTIASAGGTTANGYGTQVYFDGSGHRNRLVVNQRVYSTKFDHGISTDLTIDETSTPGSRLITGGTAIVYHNKLKAKATTTFTNLVYDNTCCQPVSGTITTTFTCPTSNTLLCRAIDGKTETLTISGCGTATLVDTSKTSTHVNLDHCL